MILLEIKSQSRFNNKFQKQLKNVIAIKIQSKENLNENIQSNILHICKVYAN